MPEIFKRKILKLLRHPDYKPLKLAQLARALGVSTQQCPQFEAAFEQLRQAGHITLGSRNLISQPIISGRVIGTFRANPRGFGFVTPLEPDSHEDLFIPPNAAADAMNGDIVAAMVVKKGKRAGRMRYSGQVLEILERANNRFVGTLLNTKAGWLVHPDGSAFTEPICVDDVTAKNAAEKDKVVVEMLSFPTEKYLARGVIIEVLGKAGRYDSEVNSIIHQYHLPGQFEDACIRQARAAAGRFDPDSPADRENITGKTIITIDPPDAKDFDDAISLEKDTGGSWVLGVHIADVSSFIPADSPLDNEAKLRGNSIYLPAKTIPMLPEVLSNGVCSLQPGQKRFVKSVYITYDRQANILSRRFTNSIISSAQRLTYQQADRILKGHTKGAGPQVVELLKNMELLSRLIENRRIENEMLHLDLPETELIMDKSGRVTDARPADDSYPHTLIEMFMVEANEAVASLLERLDITFMRRIHPEPDSLSMKNLAKLLRAVGLASPSCPDRSDLQNLLAAVKGTERSLAVNLLVLRSLEKAQYSPLCIGHFALASSCYCHFTSPIRRYADLLVHRLLELYLQNRIKHICLEQDLAGLGKHISFTEQRAEDAERELKTVLILQMLSRRIGETINGVVTGLANFGVFVKSQKFGIEGLIRTEDLGPDQWRYDQKTQSVTAVNSGCCIHLGRSMQVRIVSVNVPARQLNLCPAEPLFKKQVKKPSPRRAKRKRR